MLHEIELVVFPIAKRLRQSCVEAGTWGINLKDASKVKARAQDETDTTPESESPKKRKREDGDASPAKKRQAVQMCSARAFLTVAVDNDEAEVKWLSKDECGQAALKGFVKFHLGLTMKDWQARCVTNYDLQEQQLTDMYNKEKIIALAVQRQRVVCSLFDNPLFSLCLFFACSLLALYLILPVAA